MNKESHAPSNAPEHYWNRAGEVGYAEAMYTSGKVAVHVKDAQRAAILEGAHTIGLGKDSRILELGCGDGDLANTFLYKHFNTIEASDLAPAGIERANKNRQPNTQFYCWDITKLKFEPGQRWDAVFLIGILHHVKSFTPAIIEKLASVTDKFVILEPNGNHIGRKFLEQLPSYKDAGEDSFKKTEFEDILAKCGFEEKYFKRFNLFPNFTPDALFPVIKRVEPLIENTKALNFLCTCQVFAFEKKR